MTEILWELSCDVFHVPDLCDHSMSDLNKHKYKSPKTIDLEE